MSQLRERGIEDAVHRAGHQIDELHREPACTRIEADRGISRDPADDQVGRPRADRIENLKQGRPAAETDDVRRAGESHGPGKDPARSEAHTSELQSIMRMSYAVFGLKNTTKR